MKGEPIGDRFDWVDRIVGDAIEGSCDLSPQTLDFALSLADRLGRFGPDTYLSERQIKWLEDIERKLSEDDDGRA